MILDIKDYFLMTPLPVGERKYMSIHSKYFDSKIRNLHNLHNKIDSDGYVYCKIQLSMYRLKQVAILAYKLIEEHLTNIFSCYLTYQQQTLYKTGSPVNL